MMEDREQEAKRLFYEAEELELAANQLRGPEAVRLLNEVSNLRSLAERLLADQPAALVV